ncbi:MAG: hypothetical protein EOP84_18295 [Verrucomicrobiaceae bacterium]|nr:MAG: hypothetical protein EOP84_18295 [Verrucomicrobiaceae bacterium]
MKAMQGAGLSTADLLKSATINGSKIFGKESQFGSLTEGKLANVLVLKQNPLDNIDALINIETVINRGYVTTPAKLMPNSPENLAQQQLNAVERSVVVKTFAGQLVPQEVLDAPAVDLLARLRRRPPAKQSVTARPPPLSGSGGEHFVAEDGTTRLVATLKRLGGRAFVTELAREAGYLPSEDEVDEADRVGAFYLALAIARQKELLADHRLPGGEVLLELAGP